MINTRKTATDILVSENLLITALQQLKLDAKEAGNSSLATEAEDMCKSISKLGLDNLMEKVRLLTASNETEEQRKTTVKFAKPKTRIGDYSVVNIKVK